MRQLVLTVLVVCAVAHTLAQSGAQPQKAPPKRSVPPPELSAFLPAAAVLIKELPVNFEPEDGRWIVLAYALPERPPYDFQCTAKVLEYRPDTGWTLAYEQSDLGTNGGGPFDALRIEKVTSPAGKEGVVVVLKTAGAGTATYWYMVTAVEGRFSKLDSVPIRDAVLRKRNYEFMGYNSVSVKGDLVTEFVPGYSHGRARCCPDRPSLDVVFQFTGSSLTLHSVKRLPLVPQDHAPQKPGAAVR